MTELENYGLELLATMTCLTPNRPERPLSPDEQPDIRYIRPYRLENELRVMMHCMSGASPKAVIEPAIIMLSVSEALGLHPSRIKSKSRERDCVDARFITMMLMDEECAMVPQEIGDYLERDRTTILYGLETATQLLTNKEFFRKKLAVDEQLFKNTYEN